MKSIKISINRLSLYIDNKQILKDIFLEIPTNNVIALIGPSGCGKSTLLRTLNRMHDLTQNVNILGNLYLDNINIYDKDNPVTNIRKKIGMVFQKPNPFPKSIYDNLAYALNIHNHPKSDIPQLIEQTLKDCYLWEEVKNDLNMPAARLSGGQQQRLCIARAIVLKPEVILMDEPCSALDPISTAKIEELIIELKKEYTIIIVTHNLQQAQRISDKVAFMYLGEVIEYDTCDNIFNKPQGELTQNYINGHFG